MKRPKPVSESRISSHTRTGSILPTETTIACTARNAEQRSLMRRRRSTATDATIGTRRGVAIETPNARSTFFRETTHRDDEEGRSLPRKQQSVETPVCPSCKAKFSHSNTEMICTKCGLPDEVKERGPRAVKQFQIRAGLYTVRASTWNRRRRKHGVPRGGSIPKNPNATRRRKHASNG